MKKQFLLATCGVTILLASCTKETVPPEDDLKIPYNQLSTTSNYFTTFVDENKNTTVNFEGQTTRIAMLKELDGYIKTGKTNTLEASKMTAMFKHENSPFADADLNTATSKTLISKTAASFPASQADEERQRFISYFNAVAEVSTQHGAVAEQGQAGILDGNYLVSEKGFEYAQFIQKGLMGAIMLDQISNVYLGTEKMAADNGNKVEGQNYTALEHHWDEAYGYLTPNEVYPKQDPNDASKWLESFLGSYVRQVGPAVNGDPTAVYMAFLKGRAAIVNKDIKTRDEQISYLQAALEKAIATVAISYLNKSKVETVPGAKFHALSEGIGFIYALRFAHQAKVNSIKSNELIDILTDKPNGFWDLTPADYDLVRQQLSDLTGISADVIVNH